MKVGPAKLSELARHVVLPRGIVSTGWPAVRDTCGELGLAFDPWQDGAGRAILAKRADGLYAADTVAMSIPRQVGKTFLIGAISFALCIRQPETTVVWTAHRFKTARETFMSLKAMALRKSMQPHVDEGDIYSGSGNELIGFRNGSRILFGARERGFGRGFSDVDVLMFDEAQILSEAAIEDMVPATNAAYNPLIFLTGTPPRPIDPSEVFESNRRAALDGTAEDVLYVEFSADEGADTLDREQWAKANPSYPTRTSARAILRMRKNLSAESFRREALGIWDDPETDRSRPVPLEIWAATEVDVAKPDGTPVLFVAVAKEMRSASIVVASLNGRVPHLELADHRDGTGWVTDRLKELKATYPTAKFAAFHASPLKSWVPTLQELGIELQLLTSSDNLAACSHFEKLAEDAGFTHAPSPILTESLRGAQRRDLDDSSWKWDWKASTGNPAPIVAATGALWLLESQPSYDLLQSVW